jgi:hypothetical protein
MRESTPVTYLERDAAGEAIPQLHQSGSILLPGFDDFNGATVPLSQRPLKLRANGACE